MWAVRPTPETTRTEEVLIDVFREQRGRLWGFFARSAETRDLAEDHLQETFLRTWDHRVSLGVGAAGEEGLRRAARQYLWRVARNLLIEEIRARQRQRVRRPEAPKAAAADPGHEERVELQDCLRVVHETVDRLPRRGTRCCVRLWLEGKGLEAIAEEMGMEVGSVRGLLQRGKAEVILRAANTLRGPRGKART